ncbi:sodium channel protein Nach-like [Schistocerca gregaria]|uniref:sodium channel protein Nach-like n=1 Tax=Schistocerca gregaria TaxID=7010 RepID=UPI00211DB1C1|nr:sodium channel protein Nach-like [Schistocerca gregaria]
MWRTVLREFAEETTLHGCRYLVPGRSGPCVRLCWLVAMAVSAGCAVVFVSQAWRQYRESPIRTTVRTTNFPLSEIPFPAVTVCPTTKVRRTVGEKLLASLLNLTELNDTVRGELRLVMAMLANHEFPYNYRVWQYYNSSKDIISKLNDKLNVTWFMLQVMPPLEKMLGVCIWQGKFQNCTSIFSLQRTEGGFCYSFNSLTSEASRHCLASGPTTGLELTLYDAPDADKISPEQRDHHGFRVLVQNVEQPPESARGLLVARRRGHAMKLLLSAALTDSRRHLLRLSPRQRGCLFESEATPLLATVYSFKTCLMDCRLQHILRHCRCVPYYFNHVPGDLRFYRVDDGGAAESGESAGALNCSCLPDCHIYEYGVDARYEANPAIRSDAYIDVYYSESAAVFYLRELTFDAAQLIVSFGGILSLFLGVSVLSLAEVPHFVLRLVTAMYHGSGSTTTTEHQPQSVWVTTAPGRRHPAVSGHPWNTASGPKLHVPRDTASIAGSSHRLRTRKGTKWLGRKSPQLPLFRGALRLKGGKIAAVGAPQEHSDAETALARWRASVAARP